MELVYLWVEEYKNIKNQGFNFSPRFSCKYEDGELTVTENEHNSIFHPNINVTAIVGENGAGKSSIQKLIFLLIFLKKYETYTSTNPDDSKINAIIEILKNKKLQNKNIFLIVHTESGYKKISLLAIANNYRQNSQVKDYISTSILCPINQYSELTTVDFFSIHFHYMIDTWYDDFYDAWTNSLYHRVDGYDTPLLLEPYKGHEEGNNYIDISNIEYLNNGRIFSFYGNLKNNQHITKFFNPNTIWRMIDSDKIIQKYNRFDNLAEGAIDIHLFEKFIDQKTREKDLININKLYLAIKIIGAKQTIFQDKDIIKNIEKQLSETQIEEDINNFLSKFSTEIALTVTGVPETQKIESCIEFDKKFRENLTDLNSYKKYIVLDPRNTDTDHFRPINEIFSLFNKLPPWIYVEFYENDKSYSSLSSGEKMLLNFILNMMNQVQNIEKQGDTYKTINFFLDEVEFGLHPDWQKRFVEVLFFALKNCSKKINLIFATHSPFILSDIPKENVIFLENGKQVDPNIETFGANIHTLLSHGFFMKDGLMGEFAKSKISKILNFLNGKCKFIDTPLEKIKPTIQIIGEDFLREKLLKMYEDKFPISKEEKIKQLEDELKRLKHD